SFEMELINSKTKHRQPGNYASCEADKYGIGLTYKDEPYWWIYDVKEFKEWLDKNKDRFKTKTLLQWRIDDNRRQGRVFDDAANILVPVEVIANELGSLTKYE
ncbi:UNVERIFIED_CONTAM: hypothetical protein RF648_19940, partial [Kocuria sp. CPCC 205274]